MKKTVLNIISIILAIAVGVFIFTTPLLKEYTALNLVVELGDEVLLKVIGIGLLLVGLVAVLLIIFNAIDFSEKRNLRKSKVTFATIGLILFIASLAGLLIYGQEKILKYFTIYIKILIVAVILLFIVTLINKPKKVNEIK